MMPTDHSPLQILGCRANGPVAWANGDTARSIATFHYDGFGLLSRIEGVIERDFAWTRNAAGVLPSSARNVRRFRIQRDGNLRYDYVATERIVTLTAILDSGRKQRLYYNLATGNMDLLDP